MEEKTSKNLVYASRGKRLTNLLIDLSLIVLLTYSLLATFKLVAPNVDIERGTESILHLWIGIVIGLSYYTLSEKIFKGKSIAKFITKTVAVNYDGTPPSIANCFMRALIRVIPPYLIFLDDPSYCWHDKWTDTMVIDEKQSTY